MSSVSNYQEWNLMTPSNLAIVFSPSVGVSASCLMLLMNEYEAIFC